MAHILAIDDDEAMLALIKNTLKKDGHDVTCIPKITERLKEQLSSYDLILLDVMMPDVDGYTFCREIRDLTDCPILFLTARSLEEDVQFGFSVGADDYMKKPFSILELRARIGAHLRREQREKIRCFSVGSVRFYLTKKEVRVTEQKLSFTKSEYDQPSACEKSWTDLLQRADLRKRLWLRQGKRYLRDHGTHQKYSEKTCRRRNITD